MGYLEVELVVSSHSLCLLPKIPLLLHLLWDRPDESRQPSALSPQPLSHTIPPDAIPKLVSDTATMVANVSYGSAWSRNVTR